MTTMRKAEDNGKRMSTMSTSLRLRASAKIKLRMLGMLLSSLLLTNFAALATAAFPSCHVHVHLHVSLSRPSLRTLFVYVFRQSHYLTTEELKRQGHDHNHHPI
jgi:hypothetical protein